ncbi:MAG TPA: methyltransferase domain-containing protein [Longimicrobiales bacterium]
MPQRADLEALLATHAPLAPVPLCPEIRAHQAHNLVAVWEAAERLAGRPLAAPFWAYAWPAGCALARVLLDAPALVRDRSVLDFGAGGGVTALAAARAGAASVTANDIDPWALLVTEIAAAAQQLDIATLAGDVCETPALADDFDVMLCGDLAYERREAPRQRRVLVRAAAQGATVLVADAGRTYFDATGMTLLGEYELDVPEDLEGVARRRALVYRFGG